ncbi:MAG: hypothetical protein FJ388_26510, partial [Verrucomicrobia bacterium]|nr:hypothetical protein [Verrucomicrobiota bacterium]
MPHATTAIFPRKSWLAVVLLSAATSGWPQPASSPPVKPVILDCYISTGDNHWLGSSLPIDSPASIEASFDLLKQI